MNVYQEKKDFRKHIHELDCKQAKEAISTQPVLLPINQVANVTADNLNTSLVSHYPRRGSRPRPNLDAGLDLGELVHDGDDRLQRAVFHQVNLRTDGAVR